MLWLSWLKKKSKMQIAEHAYLMAAFRATFAGLQNQNWNFSGTKKAVGMGCGVSKADWSHWLWVLGDDIKCSRMANC